MAGAPLLQDGFLTRDDMPGLIGEGAVGEIAGIVYADMGQVLPGGTNARVLSAGLPPAGDRTVTGLAAGPAKVAALRGRLVNGLITDEATAELLLA